MTEETALYRYFDAEGRLLYVGISIMPTTRQQQHKSKATWYPEFTTQTVEKYPSRSAAMAAERAAIKAEKPIHNIAHLRELKRLETEESREGKKVSTGRGSGLSVHSSDPVRNGRLGALKMHAEGKTNTAPARAAFLARFEREVDPDGTLPPEERARRAEYARREYFLRLIMHRHHGRKSS